GAERAARATELADSACLPRISERDQVCLDLGAQVLEGRWKGQPFAEVLLGLVGREAWADRRDLEQDTARLPEVDRPEVEAVDHARRIAAPFDHAFAPGDVVVHGIRPGDVMHDARHT